MPDTGIRAFYVQLGQRVREARELAGVTQEQLAVQLDLTRGSVANLEAGRQRISAYHLFLAAETLNVPIGELAGQRGRRSAPMSETPTVPGAAPEHLDLLQRVLHTAEMSDTHAAS